MFRIGVAKNSVSMLKTLMPSSVHLNLIARKITIDRQILSSRIVLFKFYERCGLKLGFDK